ncbi:MAG: L-2-amino-thiazoline-4-carboxylic acid hydrolase [Draconibacterium sp.]|nr:L-2-amino-thiazoline-4-carboxylic acid hydrolase [Draconibacterium sp.]
MEKVSIFLQRQIEARILKEVTDGLFLNYKKEEILENIRATIEKIAFEAGMEIRNSEDKHPLLTLKKHWEKLSEGSSLKIEQMEVTDSQMTFSVTNCKYADFYKELDAADLGNTMSCCRDSAFLKGFSDDIKMERSKTIMEGSSSCDFIYKLKK